MPIIFPVYLASVGHVLFRIFSWRTVLLVFLSFSPAMLAEIKGVAQYGANYFPAMFGMIMLICYAAMTFFRNPPPLVGGARGGGMLALMLVIHLLWNAYVFASDIYPSRMATTLISQYIERTGSKDLYTFRNHPLRRNIVDHLNPSLLPQLKIAPIESVIQIPAGDILLPPVSTDSIYRGSNGDYTDFDQDLVLNQIVRQGKLGDYAKASFKTLSSSLIWSQEEEILAYRYLARNQFIGDDRSRAWILDAAKIHQDIAQLAPIAEDLFLYQNNVRNIGTKAQQMMYTGHQGAVGKPVLLKGVAARMFKMGQPQDTLRAYIFKVDDQQPMWIPYERNFISQSVSAEAVHADPAGQSVTFVFNPPVPLHEGAFSIVIYRDGPASNIDFYRIYADVLGRIEE